MYTKHVVLYFISFLLWTTTFAHVELTYPEGGETFNEHDTLTITWVEAQAHNTQNWELYYSTDAGETWSVISQNIAVPLRVFEWIIPEGETSKGRIKVIQNNEVTDYQDVSSNFTVEKATGIYDEIYLETAFNSFHNYPNPFNNSTTFSFRIDYRSRVTVSVYSLTGSFVSSPINKDFSAGKHEILWSDINLTPGVYFYTIRLGKAVKTKKLVIQ